MYDIYPSLKYMHIVIQMSLQLDPQHCGGSHILPIAAHGQHSRMRLPHPSQFGRGRLRSLSGVSGCPHGPILLLYGLVLLHRHY